MARVKIIGIYSVKSPSGRVYVGQSVDIHKRFIGYKNMHGSKGQIRLRRSLEKYSPENHEYSILEKCIINDLNERERYWQDYYDVCGKNGLNCKLTETRDKKPFITEETRLKMSLAGVMKMKNISPSHLENIRKAHKKRKWLPGKPLTDDHRRKMLEALSKKDNFKGEKHQWYNSQRFGELNPFHGKKHTDESKEKVRLSRIGKSPSKETLLKLSAVNSLGNNNSAKLVLCMETGIFYDCGKEAWMSTSRKYVYSTFKSKLNGSNKYPLSFRYV